MSPNYRCPACDLLHQSRLHAPSQAWLTVFMTACGSVMEPCPRTGSWVEVSLAEIDWSGVPAAPLGLHPVGVPARRRHGRGFGEVDAGT